MNLISSILSNTFIAFLILISIVVVAHEFGHFLAGRLLGIDVEEFAVGFGPKIFSFKIGRTEYRVNWVLLGGYVRFYGADLENSKTISQADRERSILHAKLYKRMCVSFAGPFANFVLSLVIMTFLYSFGVTKQLPVFKVMPDSVAYQSGLRSGDKVLSIDGKKISDWQSMMQDVANSPNKPLHLEVERNNTTQLFVVTPKSEQIVEIDGTSQVIGRIGVTPFLSEAMIAPWQEQFFSAIGLTSGDKIVSINGQEIQYLHQVFEQTELATHSTSDTELAKRILNKSRLPLLHIVFTRNATTQSLDVNFNSPKMQNWAHAVLKKQNNIVHTTWANSVAASELTVASTNLDCGLKPNDTIRKINNSNLFASQIDVYGWLEKETNLINKNVGLFKNNSIPVHIFATNPVGKEVNYSCFLPIRQNKTSANKETLTVDLSIKFVTNPVLYPSIKVQAKNFGDGIKMGFNSVVTQMTFIYTGFKKLFSGNVPLSSLGGPIAIAGFAGEAAKAGFETFLLAMSLMSINIGIFNLLPLPMLDGGTLLLQFVELFYRKPIPKNVQMMIARLGIAFLLTLFVFVFYNDIMRLFS